MPKIDNIRADIDGRHILTRFSVASNADEMPAIIGPNGAGKSMRDVAERRR